FYSNKSKNYYLLNDIIICERKNKKGKYLNKYQNELIDQITNDRKNFENIFYRLDEYFISEKDSIILFTTFYSYLPWYSDPNIIMLTKDEEELLLKRIENYFKKEFEISGNINLYYNDLKVVNKNNPSDLLKIKNDNELISADVFAGYRIPFLETDIKEDVLNKKKIDITIKNINLELQSGEYIKIDDLIIYNGFSNNMDSAFRILSFNEIEINSKLKINLDNLINEFIKKNKGISSIEFITESSKDLERRFKLEIRLKKLPFLTELRFKVFQNPPKNEDDYPDNIILSVTSLKFGKVFRFPLYPLQGIAYKNYSLMPFEGNPFSVKFKLRGENNE
ncbi:MAG: hypothetical protein PHV06_05320, partial [bacterium]|nr:hypothetical protein [bacterium]